MNIPEKPATLGTQDDGNPPPQKKTPQHNMFLTPFLPFSFKKNSFVLEPWSCYSYSKTDQNEMRQIGERKVCEKDGGRAYKRGRGRFNRGFKGCGKCRCCERNGEYRI